MEEYRDPEVARGLANRIRAASRKKIRLMEVCGTHTMAIFRSGIRELLPETVSLISGPGCPVCVTSRRDIDSFIALSREEGVILATFGDLLRVPGSASTLQKERAGGRDVRIVYSTLDALEIARGNPDRKVVFLGVGFETTAPTVAASLLRAEEAGLSNYLVFSAHKRVPPALSALIEKGSVNVDGFILPGHVSVIIGTDAYLPFFRRHAIPCVVAGFEPADILRAVEILVEQIEAGTPRLENAYPRGVTAEGNRKAREIMERVFETDAAEWRGIGSIPASGLFLRDAFSAFDARKFFDIEVPPSPDPKGCRCGEILKGKMLPPDCPLFRKTCTPVDPVGPCMVSSEGTCAAYFRYHPEGPCDAR